eukprot:NODE_689_length_5162_cov_0.365001.p1 type:complete len:1110 gc:universal NODE_689_length_5162_cov_0.365001:1547-4876(+)
MTVKLRLVGRPSFEMSNNLGKEKESITIDSNNTMHVQHFPEKDKDKEKITTKKSIDVTEHLKSIDEVCALFESNFKSGLSSEVAAARLLRDGLNQLTPPKRKSPILIYFKQWIQPFALLPLTAGFLCFVLYGITIATNSPDLTNLYLGIVLMFVVGMNAFIESVQELKSNSVLSSFGNMIPQQTMVCRDSSWIKIESKSLVVGDLMKIKEGDKIPADIRCIQVNNCKVDNSSLTGEVEPVVRKLESKRDNPLEAENLAFFGTLCVGGDASGIVIRTGDHTVIGSIAHMSNSGPHILSPLHSEITKFVKLIASVALIVALIFFFLGIIIGENIIDNFQFFIGIFVANVPQGLPATVSMLLTFAAKRLSKRNVLVKDLRAVDTLGAITLLASDKTGTMTQNRMTLTNFWTSKTILNDKNSASTGPYSHSYAMPGVALTADSVAFNPKENTLLMDSMALNILAEYDKSDSTHNKINGDATESGILRFLYQTKHNEIIANYPRLFNIPFNSANKWALTIHKYPHPNGDFALFIKGAPERVLRMCSKTVNGLDLTDTNNNAFNAQFNSAYKTMASQGQRVLAMAYMLISSSDAVFDDARVDSLVNEKLMTFIGLISLIDPPKDRVSKAIGSCQTAGITVIMVTGDHPLTAEAIARQVGLLIGETREQVALRLNRDVKSIGEDEYRAVVVHGENLESFSNLEWDRILNKKEIVFARTSPKQKLEIVARCQAKGHVVAATGDGVNDSPALKRADLGISMNISGSDVSKEAAKMILMDDNFATIVEGIAEGRLIFANLKKAIRYTLTHVTPENMAFLLHIILPLPLMMTPFLILMLDLFTDAFPAITYAFEAEEEDLMGEQPRRTVVAADLVAIDDEDARNLGRIPSFRVETKNAPTSKGLKGLWGRYVDAVWTRKINKSDESLIDRQLLFVSYVQMGFIIHIGSLIAFFLIFYLGVEIEGINYSLGPSQLFGYRSYREDMMTFHGISQSTYDLLLSKAQSGYFINMICAQAADLIITKVKYGNIFSKQIFINKMSYLGIAFSFSWACLVVYCPGITTVLTTSGPRGEVFLVGLGSAIGIIIYDTSRKYVLKKGYFGGINARPATKIDGIKHVLTRD